MLTNLLEKALVRGFVGEMQTTVENSVLALFGVLRVDTPSREGLRVLRLPRAMKPAPAVELPCGDVGVELRCGDVGVELPCGDVGVELPCGDVGVELRCGDVCCVPLVDPVLPTS